MSWLEEADLAPCGCETDNPGFVCGKPVVLDHDPPCPHGYIACPECGWESVCHECAALHEAER